MPSSPNYIQVLMRLRADEIAAIDAYRRARDNPPSRSRAAEEMFRRAIHAHDWATKAMEAEHAER
jgi:hypothetical protein